jgi:hypothetical protein
VARFFDSLAKLEISEFYKDAVTDFAAYGLVPPVRQYVLKTAVSSAAGITNRILTQVDFGTNSMDNKVFVRRADEISVYTVANSASLQLPQAAFQMRSRRVWTFESTNVTSVAVTQNGQTRTLARDLRRMWSSDLIANEAIEETVHRLAALEASGGWAARGDEASLRTYGFKENPHQIALNVMAGETAQTFTVSFGKALSQGVRFAAVVMEEGQPIIFRFPVPLYDMIQQYLGVSVDSPNL